MTSPSEKVRDMLSADSSQLKKSNKDDLCTLIVFLRGKVEELESYQLVSKRVQLLEKTLVSSMQYSRRESIEIHGLPETIKDEELEGKCLGVLEDIGCGKIDSSQVHACHRLKNKNNTIIRFVNRKFADKALHNKSKLKNINREKYGVANDKNIYINENLCRPMQYLAYKVRQALRDRKIVSYNIWKGKLSVKLVLNGRDIVISHVQDLIDIHLACEEDKQYFLA